MTGAMWSQSSDALTADRKAITLKAVKEMVSVAEHRALENKTRNIIIFCLRKVRSLSRSMGKSSAPSG